MHACAAVHKGACTLTHIYSQCLFEISLIFVRRWKGQSNNAKGAQMMGARVHTTPGPSVGSTGR